MDVFSSVHGRISLIAKGIKNKKAQKNALIQPAQGLELAWSGRGELGTLTHIEPNKKPLRFSGKNQLAVFYLNELLIRLLHQHVPHPALFAAYDQALCRLSEDEDPDYALRIFEKKLLDELGYGLVLDHDVQTGEAITPAGAYYYQIEHGPLRSPPAADEYVALSGATLLALHTEKLQAPAALREAKQLMRMSLNRHLGNKALASRELYRAYLKHALDR